MQLDATVCCLAGYECDDGPKGILTMTIGGRHEDIHTQTIHNQRRGRTMRHQVVLTTREYNNNVWCTRTNIHRMSSHSEPQNPDHPESHNSDRSKPTHALDRRISVTLHFTKVFFSCPKISKSWRDSHAPWQNTMFV